MRRLLCAALWFVAALPVLAQPRKLLVISIDGLDHRYLQDRDAMGLRTPNLRKLVDEGKFTNGAVGVVPTVTWPSHTTLITGVRAEEHGILENNVRTATGSERYWYTSYLKAPTLWQVAKRAGRSVAAITWPVTVGEGIDYNLPEYFQARAGGGMDLKSIEEKATPGLVRAISAQYPSFATEFMDDRTRALGTIFILQKYQPDLTLLHFVDHDEAAHNNGPFSRAAIATLEYTDELIGQILQVLPPRTVVALVSDHGFEADPRELNMAAFFQQRKLSWDATNMTGGYVSTANAATTEALRAAGRQADSCIGREIPRTEVQRFLPAAEPSLAFFEPAAGCYFTRGVPNGELIAAHPGEAGRHGHWPTRYRASFVLWGPGIAKERAPEMDMLDAAKQFAAILELPWPPAR